MHRLLLADNREVNEPLIRSGLAGLLDSDVNGFILIACDEHGLPIGYAAVSTGWSLEVGGADYVLDEIFVQQRAKESVGSSSTPLKTAVPARCSPHLSKRTPE